MYFEREREVMRVNKEGGWGKLIREEGGGEWRVVGGGRKLNMIEGDLGNQHLKRTTDYSGSSN